MSAGPASLCSTLLFVSVFVFVSADHKIIIAVPGEDVTLPCQAPDNKHITGVKWSREDIADKNVFLYQRRLFDATKQHPFFKNRVDLKDRRMKGGDASLILKDVIDACNGKYECRVFIEETRSWKSIRTIRLGVVPPGKLGKIIGVVVGLVVAVAVAGCGYLMCKKDKTQETPNPE